MQWFPCDLAGLVTFLSEMERQTRRRNISTKFEVSMRACYLDLRPNGMNKQTDNRNCVIRVPIGRRFVITGPPRLLW